MEKMITGGIQNEIYLALSEVLLYESLVIKYKNGDVLLKAIEFEMIVSIMI